MSALATIALPEGAADDIAVQIGQRLGRALARYEELDRKESAARQSKNSMDEIYIKSAAEQAYDEELALKDALSVVPTASVLGALVQVYAALCRFDHVHERIPESEMDFNAHQDIRAVDRLLWSAFNALDAATGGAIRSVIPEHCMGLNCNVGVPVEERLAILRAQYPEVDGA